MMFYNDFKGIIKGDIPKAHYKFYWTEERKDYILLDILFEEHKYPKIIQTEIQTDWLISEAPYSIVNIPTKEVILGDKLTAFAPNTTGVPYGKNKETEIIKQLFDVSVLTDEVDNLKIVYDSFIKIAENEITYRNLNITPSDVLDDIFETVLLISKRERNTTEPDKSKFKELQKGLRSFGNFLIKGGFRIEHAIEASAKIAWLAVKLKNRDFSPITYYDNSFKLQELTNTNPNFAHINKLKRSNNPAYYYWWNCLNDL
ncbi:MAG: hypothetical protein K8R54_14725 [Bacteroidales bacterium]|nr:hypothetical protein [Bacteroidales bacterium]